MVKYKKLAFEIKYLKTTSHIDRENDISFREKTT